MGSFPVTIANYPSSSPSLIHNSLFTIHYFIYSAISRSAASTAACSLIFLAIDRKLPIVIPLPHSQFTIHHSLFHLLRHLPERRLHRRLLRIIQHLVHIPAQLAALRRRAKISPIQNRHRRPQNNPLVRS